MQREIMLVVDNVRSTHNVGSFFRTSDAFGVNKIYLTGITPYPKQAGDKRLPYLAEKIDKQIAKTALGAERTVAWQYSENIQEVLTDLKSQDFQIMALEQTKQATYLNKFKPEQKIALVVGAEVGGVSPAALKASDQHVQIYMGGKKESLNVSVAAGIALFYLRQIAI